MNASNPLRASTSQNDSVAPKRWRPHLRQVIQGLLGMGVAAALLVWGLPHFAGTTWPAVFDILQGIGRGTALKLLALMLCGLWLYTFMLTGSLPGLSHAKALIVNVCGSSVGNLLPGGGAAGVAATYGMCRSWGFSHPEISTSVIVTGVWNVLGRVSLPILGMALLLPDAASLPTPVMRGGAIGSVVGVALLAVFVAVIVSERVASVIGRGLDRAHRSLRRRSSPRRDISIDQLVSNLRAQIANVVKTGWLTMTFGLVGFLAVYYVLFWFCLDAVNLQLSTTHMFAAYAVGRLLSTVGITPGGVGITETGTAAVLIAFGAEPAAATAGVVLFSIYIHLLEIPLGAIGWVAWGLSRKQGPADAFKASPVPEPLMPDPCLKAPGEGPPAVPSPAN